MIKKIKGMDFYELLNLRADASPREIENAYLMAVSTYHQEGLASYGALGDLDRGLLWDKIKATARRSWSRKDGREHRQDGYGPERLPEDFYYYGDYLKKVRERRGISREDIADRCGISPARIELLEQESPPSFPHEEELLEGLKLYAKSLGLGSEKGRASPFSDRLA